MVFNRPPVGAELPIKKEQHAKAQGASKQLRLCSLYERIQHPSGGMASKAALATGVGVLLSPLLLHEAGVLLHQPSFCWSKIPKPVPSFFMPFLLQKPERQKRDRVKM